MMRPMRTITLITSTLAIGEMTAAGQVPPEPTAPPALAVQPPFLDDSATLGAFSDGVMQGHIVQLEIPAAVVVLMLRRHWRAAAVLANRALVVLEAGSVRVAHDLIREAAERELPEEEGRRLHSVLADWLERIAGNDLQLLASALEHRQAAGLAVDDLALRIARSPQRRLLGGEPLAIVATPAATDTATSTRINMTVP